MATQGDDNGDLGYGYCSHPLYLSLLSQPWKNPGHDYPSTPGLIDDLQELCNVIPLPKLKAAVDPKASDPEEKLKAICEYELFKLQQPNGEMVSEAKRKLALAVATRYSDKVKSHFLGFQANHALSYSHLSHFLDTHVNNLGDPYTVGSFLSQSKFMERAVLDYFAALWRADWPHEILANSEDPEGKAENPESYWGFVLSMGCTEGTLYGLWNGRDYLAGKIMLMDMYKQQPRYVMTDQIISPLSGAREARGDQSKTPVCFFSADSHYSLKKAMVILNIKTFHDVAKEYDFPVPESLGSKDWPEEVPSLPDGSGAMDVEKLAILVEEFARRGYPALICFNYGTTFKGAYDDVVRAADLLLPIFRAHNLEKVKLCYVDPVTEDCTEVERNGFWFHVDGALGAAYMPYLRMAKKCGMFTDPDDTPIPEFDFSLRGKNLGEGQDYSEIEVVKSIGLSGHKWIGAPVPTGIYMTKSKYQLSPPNRPNYIGTPDTTFAGSRSGLASVFLWDYFSRHSFNDLMAKAVYTENIARTLHERLKNLDEKVKNREIHPDLPVEQSLWVWRTPLSLGVIFRRPNKTLVRKYSLSEEEEFHVTAEGETVSHKLVHAYAMEHVTMDRINSLMEDLCQQGAFDLDEEKPHPFLRKSAFKIEW